MKPSSTSPHFVGVRPVCRVLDMAVDLAFWRSLGFSVGYSDRQPSEAADYATISRSGVEMHLQTYGRSQPGTTEVMALRVELRAPSDVDQLYAEWRDKAPIISPPAATGWGTYEFAFYDPSRIPFAFYADRT
ncbi:MAG TPA: VOC family protein [Devosia sp.]|nr:VOC family protein [Devosia sp.]